MPFLAQFEIYLLASFVLLFSIGCNDSKSTYDQLTAIEFANGKITTSNGIQFAKDGKTLLVSKKTENLFDNGKAKVGIFIHKFENGKWNTAQPIRLGLEIDAYHPVLSSNNKILYFNSRSDPDNLDKSIPHNIWHSKKTEKGWDVPELVQGINSDRYDSYPSIARNQNLYFNSDRDGGKGGMDIYVSIYEDGYYQKPINIQSLNSKHEENDLVIDPNEKFIIFNRYDKLTKELDLYISFQKSKDWTKPKALHNINVPDKWELTPTLSPRGNYFYFELDGKIMQIDLVELLNTNSVEKH